MVVQKHHIMCKHSEHSCQTALETENRKELTDHLTVEVFKCLNVLYMYRDVSFLFMSN